MQLEVRCSLTLSHCPCVLKCRHTDKMARRCHAGYFKRGGQCVECVLAAGEVGGHQPQVSRGQCSRGSFKRCSADGVGRCEHCTNPLPIHAEFSAAGSSAFPYACPWTCRPGFWFNRTQNECMECTGYKPKNAHFVTASSSQVHGNPKPQTLNPEP